MTTISCIIPAYNEAPRIGAVLDRVLGHPQIAEVIVIDDGSRDGTPEIAEGYRDAHPHLRVLRQAQNGGKTAAVAAGIAEATGSHLMLLDSDLLGLTHGDLGALIAPVTSGQADVTISLRRNAPRTWRAIGLDYISGERVIPREMLATRLDALNALPRFGLEVFMNRLWIADRARIAVVHWPGVDSPMKSAKLGNWRAGLAADARMMRDIFRTIAPHRALSQILAMRGLRVRADALPSLQAQAERMPR
ncbi:glycosyl transferase (plasmid) [Thioclava nitratireducens]|uniref:Glycosyl transferase n=1 Tax=Thioclava nitratireducens TaxID=1915078 RepID=A0ABN4XCZ5_9RHOB|nr:glycosyltransferase family 2 protein [Thioclava nitratireducens]AQS50217.1 glycosyl transferase [Thioclava nitratireducens]MCB1466746.1 glycosyltransferase family 2 protein [Rhizobiaceae bacterium]